MKHIVLMSRHIKTQRDFAEIFADFSLLPAKPQKNVVDYKLRL
jgi:hypothetical protein